MGSVKIPDRQPQRARINAVTKPRQQIQHHIGAGTLQLARGLHGRSGRHDSVLLSMDQVELQA